MNQEVQKILKLNELSELNTFHRTVTLLHKV